MFKIVKIIRILNASMGTLFLDAFLITDLSTNELQFSHIFLLGLLSLPPITMDTFKIMFCCILFLYLFKSIKMLSVFPSRMVKCCVNNEMSEYQRMTMKTM